MSVVADLATLKRVVGATSTRDDDLLGWALDAATTQVVNRVYARDFHLDDVQEGILLMASRLYKRRLSPEGVAGWNEMGVVKIVGNDPDISALIAPHEDFSLFGIA
jgi:hypothetical protein